MSAPWWNAYAGSQFLHKTGADGPCFFTEKPLPPGKGPLRVSLRGAKTFWERDMGEVAVLHVAEMSASEEKAGGLPPRHLCLTVNFLESGVSEFHGLPQFFWHRVDGATFNPTCSADWAFDESHLQAAWTATDEEQKTREFDAGAFRVPGAEPFAYTDAAVLRAEVDALRGGAADVLAGAKLKYVLARVAEQIFASTTEASSDVTATVPGLGECGTILDAAASLADIPRGRRFAAATLIAQGEATLADVSAEGEAGHLRALVVEAWGVKVFCTDCSVGGIFANALTGGNITFKHEESKDHNKKGRPTLHQGSQQLVAALLCSGAEAHVPFRLRSLPLNGLMLSLSHHAWPEDEVVVHIEVNGSPVATITSDVESRIVDQNAAVVTSVHILPAALRCGKLTPGDPQKGEPGKNNLVIRATTGDGRHAQYWLRALRLQPWVEREPTTPAAVEAPCPQSCSQNKVEENAEFWPIFSAWDWLQVMSSLDRKQEGLQGAGETLVDDGGEPFKMVFDVEDGNDLIQDADNLMDLADIDLDIEVKAANKEQEGAGGGSGGRAAHTFALNVCFDSRVTGCRDEHDQELPDFVVRVLDELGEDDVKNLNDLLDTTCISGGEGEASLGQLVQGENYPERLVAFGSSVVAAARRKDPAARFKFLLGTIAGRLRRGLELSTVGPIVVAEGKEEAGVSSSPASCRASGKKVIDLTAYSEDFGPGGVLDYLRTELGRTLSRSRADGKPSCDLSEVGHEVIGVGRSTNGCGTARDALKLWPSTSGTRNKPGQWWQFDFKMHQINSATITKYSLMHGGAPGLEGSLRSWQLQGSADGGDSWIMIDERDGDESLQDGYEDSPRGGKRSKFQRHTWTCCEKGGDEQQQEVWVGSLRIIQTGVNSDGRSHELHLSGFEVYGVLRER